MSPRHPPHWDLTDADPVRTLAEQGFVRLRASTAAVIAGSPIARHQADWNDLPADIHLRDGGRYRFRRHASVVLDEDMRDIAQRIERPHWQPTDYNALHGGVLRDFAPIHEAVLRAPALLGLVTGLGRLCAAVAGNTLRYAEVHQFRISTRDGIGRPTPEGAHRDGVDFVAVVLLARVSVRGGETRVFDADGPDGLRFVMDEPGSVLLLDDARMIHETTPLQPDDNDGHRDTLVITWRRDGFLDPP